MADEAESLPDGGFDLAKVGAHWQQELERAQRYFKSWIDRCVKIEKIYLQQADQQSAKRRFPMLWANTSVLQPAVYARVPQPVVERRFKDSQPVARMASELVERNLAFTADDADLDSIMRAVRDDFLLCARGTVWLRYEADFEPIDMGVEPSDAAGAPGEGFLSGGMGDNGAPTAEQITDERVCIDYVHWSDFLHSPARRWKDVTWVARRVPMTDEEFDKRFPEGRASLAANGAGSNHGTNQTERAQNEGKTYVWEIWCKSENYTVWSAEGSPVALEVSEPPLKLTRFFPCPRPAFGTLSTGSLIPVPDYVYYQGQCDEIDILTKRINKLTDQLRLKVFYPSGDGSVSPAIEKAMRPDNDTVMVPIPEWAAFTDKGGSNAIVTLPIDQVQKVIVACIEVRKQLVEDVYQITGISDIVRGDTQASETATAQRIKSQWGSIRIRDRQAELARFARDIVNLAGEIICDQFQPETLMLVSGIQLPTAAQKQQVQMQMQQQQMAQQQAAMRAQQIGQPAPPPQPPQLPPEMQKMMEQPTIDEVVQLLRNDSVRGFRIDIETDSTIEPDEDAEKQRRMEFVQMVGGFMQQAGAIAQQTPMLVPVMVETLLFAARGFRAGRQLENTLEQVGAQLSQSATAPKPPPEPTPEQMINLKTAQVKAGAEEKKAQLSVAQAQIEHQTTVEQARSDMAAQALQQFQQQPPAYQ
ncbi:hypothetical protein [Rhizobium ruizarguesonis]|uniref:hypothetical protein n=1 Tax=Rhizobium ruizarguesonis TaxID=2081791 RepID=UPI001030C8DA|nr:hypothetical protein [Rhizobium ruizarguesonis]TBA65351.1 hypothetical protein ELH57_17360 [Rhizobium ruizarguesonis]